MPIILNTPVRIQTLPPVDADFFTVLSEPVLDIVNTSGHIRIYYARGMAQRDGGGTPVRDADGTYLYSERDNGSYTANVSAQMVAALAAGDTIYRKVKEIVYAQLQAANIFPPGVVS
jgi:hypothetical protein